MAKTKKKRARSAEGPASSDTTARPESAAAPPIASTSAAPPPDPQTERRSILGARLAILFGALAAFVGTLDNEVLVNWDDERFLYDPDVVSPSPTALLHIFTEVRFEAYHPLHRLSYWLDVPWVGAEGPFAAMVIHAVSLALWIIVLFVAFDLLRKLGLRPAAACIATLAFGIHPLAVEVVAWASCRKDILALGFSFAALSAHLDTSIPSRPWHDRRAWISRSFFLLAALSKTSVLPLPLAMIACDWWLGRRSAKDALRYQLPALLLAIGLGVVVILVWIDNDMIQNRGTDAEPFHPWLIPATIHHILEASLFPVRLSALYPMFRHDPTPAWKGLLAIALLGLALAMAYQHRRTPVAARVGFGITWFVLFVLPVANIIPMFMQWQDRYCVAPMFGLALALGAIVEHLATSAATTQASPLAQRSPQLVIAAVVLLPLGWLTTHQVETWSDGSHLWGNATRRYPRSNYAWVKLGEIRRRRGDVDAAIRAYARAIEVAPELRLASAGFLYCLGLRDEARHDLSPSQALAFSERYAVQADEADRLRTLAGEMVDAGYRDAATYVLARSLDIDPVSDERIERAVSFHLRQGSIWLARFYLSRLTRRPVMIDVSAFWEAERERLGLISDEELERRREGGAPEREEGDPIVIPIGD